MEWLSYCQSFVNKVKETYKRRLGKELDLIHPATLTEKIQYLKIYDASFLKAFCADKINLHQYCNRQLGTDICIPIIAVYNRPEDINWEVLPQQFVVKCNHGSGYNIIVSDKTKVNRDSVIKQLHTWLNEDYGMIGYELHYSLITRKILIEEYKQSQGQLDLTDFKLFCFNGKPTFWQIITDRRTNEQISHYDMNWNYAPQYDWAKYSSRSDIAKPAHYVEMCDIATKLSSNFKFVRVDFYLIDDIVYLGELTFTPADGFQIFKDPTIDLTLGNMLTL